MTRRKVALVLVVVAVAVAALVFGGDLARAIKHLLERLSRLPGPVFAVVVGLLALFETAAFAGLAVPGELAVILGGVAAYEGKVPVEVMAACAVSGAIVGDSLGFYLGRRLGTRFLDSRLGSLMGRARVEATMARIRAGGIKAIILGRFVGVLRAVMPFAAGASGLSYRRFVLASVVGATAWGIAFTALGYVAGNSWESVEEYVGRASTLLAVTLVVIAALVIGARQVAARQDTVRAWWEAQLARPRVATLRSRYRRQLDFLSGRFRPGTAAGLQLTIALLALALLGTLLAVVFGEVLRAGGLMTVDEDIRDALADSRTPELVDLMRWVRDALATEVLLAVSALVGLAAWLTDRRPRGLVLLLAAVLGAVALAQTVQAVVERSRSIVTLDGLATSTFPSGRMTVIAAFAFALATVALPRLPRWTWKVAAATLLLGVVLLGALAVLFLGQVYLSDVLGGIALGAVWGLAVSTAVTTIWRPPARPADEVPAAESEPEPTVATVPH